MFHALPRCLQPAVKVFRPELVQVCLQTREVLDEQHKSGSGRSWRWESPFLGSTRQTWRVKRNTKSTSTTGSALYSTPTEPDLNWRMSLTANRRSIYAKAEFIPLIRPIAAAPDVRNQRRMWMWAVSYRPNHTLLPSPILSEQWRLLSCCFVLLMLSL